MWELDIFDPWFWTVYNKNGQAYDTFSGNRNPYWRVDPRRGEEKFIDNFLEEVLKATYMIFLNG